MHYTRDLYGLYRRIFEYCPSVIIPGARNVTTCYDWIDGVYIWYVVPYVEPDFGTQLHEISHTFLYATYPAAEAHVWLKEGTGMYFESGWFDAAGELMVPRPIPYIIDNFRKWHDQQALIPLHELVNMTRDAFYAYPEPTKAYSQAGMFVFYLVDCHRAVWDELLSRLNSGAIASNAELLDFITSATGKSWAQLEAEYVEYGTAP